MLLTCKLRVLQSSICSINRQVHSSHFPNDITSINHPKPEDFEDIKNTGPKNWPFYGGRIKVQRKLKPKFPQVIPIVETMPVDIRRRQVDRTMRFGANPQTYPVMLVYADGSTVTIPYHKPVGTIYLPGDDTQISLGFKKKVKVKRRVKIGV